jgi:hypothetical protein
MALTMEQAHAFLEELAEAASEWAGIPMPLEDTKLVVHPSYPFAKVCREQDVREDQDEPEPVNRWYNRRGFEVYLWRENGRTCHGCVPVKPIDMVLKTMSISPAWKVEAEMRAMGKLSDEIGEHRFTQYLFSGTFLETSKRSNVTYVFRRLRPTLALRASGDCVKVLAGLCLHPIGYYQESWAGALVPTDDVLAHLLLMRADEPRFWKDANQIRPDRPECGAYV